MKSSEQHNKPPSNSDSYCASYKRITLLNNSNWAASWQNQQNGMCAQQRLRSAWASAQSDQNLCAWRKPRSLATHWAHSKDFDQTGWMPRPIRVFAGRTVILLVLLWGTSHRLVTWCYSRISELLQYVSSGFRCRVITGLLMRLY